MKLSVSTMETVGYLAVEVKGEWNLPAVKELIDSLVMEVKQRRPPRLPGSLDHRKSDVQEGRDALFWPVVGRTP